VVVALLLIAACGGSTSTTRSTSTAALAALSTATHPPLSTATYPLLNTGPAPWPNPDHIQARLAAAGLPVTTSGCACVHYHLHLDIFVNGRSEPVAASIAREDGTTFSPLHTHASSGMIHIEATHNHRFNLGMLFTEWGVRLTGNCVGGYCRPGTPISAYIDGRRTGDSMPDIALTKGREIALVIGSPPSNIPSRWDCRAKLNPALENAGDCADFGQRPASSG
jgi:hypothetical protein